MDIKKRITTLLKSGKLESVALAGVLLQNIPDINEQIAIFESACNKSSNASQLFISNKWIDVERYNTQAAYNIVGKNWAIYYNGGLFLLKTAYHPERHAKIEI